MFLIILCLLFCFASCTPQKMPAQTQFVFGTVCTVNLFDDGTNELYKEIFLKLNQLDDKFSAKKEYSEISKINQFGKIDKVEISQEVYELLKFSKEIALITDNSFNPTLGALINLWGIGTEHQKIPTIEEIADAKTHCNPDNVELFIEENENIKQYFAKLNDEKIKIDLGGIVKGYATDELVKMFESKKVKKAIIDLGGNIYVYGKKSANQKWNVGIKNPLASFDKTITEPIKIVSVENKSVVTSGNYERYFIENDKIYHHIIDYKTGYPVDNNLASVTVVYQKSIVCDALATAYYVAGADADFAQKMKLKDYQIIFVDKKGNILEN